MGSVRLKNVSTPTVDVGSVVSGAALSHWNMWGFLLHSYKPRWADSRGSLLEGALAKAVLAIRNITSIL